MNGPPEAAVEAAAQTWEYHPLDTYPEDVQGIARKEAREAVEAAYPILREAVAREIATFIREVETHYDEVDLELLAVSVEREFAQVEGRCP